MKITTTSQSHDQVSLFPVGVLRKPSNAMLRKHKA